MEDLAQKLADAAVQAIATQCPVSTGDRAREVAAHAIRQSLATHGGEAVAYRHTLHMELGQTYTQYGKSSDPTAEHGICGRNYDESYSVTVTPLYAAPPSPAAKGWVPAEVLSFLRGESPLDGVWFGDSHPTIGGAYWWRRLLPPAPSVDGENSHEA